MTIVAKVSSRGAGEDPDISQYVGNAESRWGDVTFHINTELDVADVWFVLEDVDRSESCSIPRGRKVFLAAETSWEADRFTGDSPGRAFLEQFDHVFTPHAAFFPTSTETSVEVTMPFLPWMINANHGISINQPHVRDVSWLRAASQPSKDREISVICSTQSRTSEHRMRLAFVEALKAHFGERLDWFGNGVNPVAEKWDALAPYRYSIALENQQMPHLITEKLFDCFLTWTHPIYWGAPNASDYFPSGALTPIDIRDFSHSVDVIEALLAEQHGDRQSNALRAARDLVLSSLHPFERMSQIAHTLIAEQGSEEIVTIRPMDSFQRVPADKSMLRRIGEGFNKVGDTLVRRSLPE